MPKDRPYPNETTDEFRKRMVGTTAKSRAKSRRKNPFKLASVNITAKGK